MKKLLIVLLAGSLGFISCKEPSKSSSDSTKTEVEKKIIPSSEIQTKYGEGLYAQMSITEGDVLIRLEMEKAPLTVANFVALAEGSMPNNAKKPGEPFFDGLTFHRVISIANGDGNDFMIQGGDPDGSGMGGPGYNFRDEFHPSLQHNQPGKLSMANSGPATNGSQFFITLSPQPHLDNVHSIYGQVVQGLDKVQRTLQGDKIKYVKIIRIGEDAKNFDAMSTFNRLKEINADS